ncbi:MAG: GatB/YqeY domain-containing protein [Candidatus Marinimicrobia bacterium]|nr:GatB/YqeY domain-containing protein [Candidatus Neomarinimicrobiota bacterium]
MGLLEKITEDMKKAMKNKQKNRMQVLRLLRSDLKTAMIDKKGEFTEEDAMAVITKAAKNRKESIESYKKGDREDLVEEEQKELEVIEEYLPEQMSDNEIKALVDEVIEETGATSMSDMGKVMGTIMPQVKGKADGNKVQAIVRSKLT